MSNPIVVFLVVWVILFFVLGVKQLDKLPKNIVHYLKVYSFFASNPLTKQKLQEIEKLYGLYHSLSREAIIIKSTESLAKFIITLVAMTGATVVVFGNMTMTLTAMIMCVAIMNINTDIKADKLYFEYVKELRLAVDIVVSEFKFSGDVSRTIMNVRGRTFLTPSLSRLYNVLNTTALDKELQFMGLLDTPIRLLRELLSDMYITSNQGDGKTSNGMSALEANLMTLRQDITNEIEAIELRKEYFSSLRGITLVPLFFMPVLVNFMASNMPITQPVYNSFYGYFIQMFILILTYLCYQFVHQNGRNSIVTTDDRSVLIHKLVVSEKLTRFIKPIIPTDPQKIFKMDQKTDAALSQKTPIYIYHQKVLLSVITLVLSTSLVLGFSVLSAKFFVNDIELKALVNRKPIDAYTAKALKDYDLEVMKLDAPPEEYEVRSRIKGVMPKVTPLELGNEINRVLVKYDQYKKGIGLKWWYALFPIIFTVASWFYAEYALWSRARLVAREVEDDLNSINSRLCLLASTKLSVRDAIYWMYVQSNVFKRILYRGYVKYTQDPANCIKDMLSQTSNPEFKQTLVTLEKAVFDVPLGRALSTMPEVKRTQAAESHRRVLRSIKEKYNDAKFAAFGPTMMVIFALLIVPLGYTAYVLITSSLKNL